MVGRSYTVTTNGDNGCTLAACSTRSLNIERRFWKAGEFEFTLLLSLLLPLLLPSPLPVRWLRSIKNEINATVPSNETRIAIHRKNQECDDEDDDDDDKDDDDADDDEGDDDDDTTVCCMEKGTGITGSSAESA